MSILEPALDSATQAWLYAIDLTIATGDHIAPRGQLTRELLSARYTLDMRLPVVDVPARGLNYKFAAAEAYWILSGSNRLAEITSYNARMSEFSDDGVTLFGAYGPRIQSQLPYVVDKLREDAHTRQAGLTIWREFPPKTKDTPCTVAMWFQLRRGKLVMHVFMRSSDLWLGFPYDVFSFSMVAHQVCCRLNATHETDEPIEPSALHLTAASSHLYETNFEDAKLCASHQPQRTSHKTPRRLFLDETVLLEYMKQLRATSRGDTLRWWEQGDLL